jgi:hypothetical protein
LLNVIARIDPGATPPSINQAARATSVVVLPLPAGAMHSDGPGGAVAAARWSGASRSSLEATSGCIRGVCEGALHRRSSGRCADAPPNRAEPTVRGV